MGSHSQRGVSITRRSDRNCARKRRSARVVGASGLPVLVSRIPVVVGMMFFEISASVISQIVTPEGNAAIVTRLYMVVYAESHRKRLREDVII